MKYIAIILLIALTGCAEARMWTEAALTEARAAKDTEARVLLAGACAVGEASKQRILSPKRQTALATLCAPVNVRSPDGP